MPTTSGHPSLPLYVHDQASYMKQMHEWHNQMSHSHEKKRLNHLEMSKHFQKMMGESVKSDPILFNV